MTQKPSVNIFTVKCMSALAILNYLFNGIDGDTIVINQLPLSCQR